MCLVSWPFWFSYMARTLTREGTKLIFLHQTRDLSLCRALAAEELRVWAGLLSMVDVDLEVPPNGMISKRCFIRTSRVTQTLRTLEENGFLNETGVNPKYASFESAGRGSAPFIQVFLRDFSRNRTLQAQGLRLFYYLLGDIRRGNIVYDTNITRIAEELNSERANTSRLIAQLIAEDFMSAPVSRVSKKHFVISRSTLGTLKRS